MATNIEQIFRSFVVNKFKEIQEEKLNSENTESSQNGQVTEVSEKPSEDTVVCVQSEGSEVPAPDTGVMPSESIELEQPHNSDLEDSTSKDLINTEISSSDEVKKDTSRKKPKKHKKHKSKKKKKKKKKEKHEKHVKSTSIVEDQENVILEPKSLWKPAFAPPPIEESKIDAILSKESIPEAPITVADPCVSNAQEIYPMKENQPVRTEVDIDSGFFGPKCPKELNYSDSGNCPTPVAEIQGCLEDLTAHSAIENSQNLKQPEGDKNTSRENIHATKSYFDASISETEVHLPEPCFLPSETKKAESSNTKLESIENNESILSPSKHFTHKSEMNISGYRSRSKSPSKKQGRLESKSRSKSKSTTRKQRSRSKSSIRTSGREHPIISKSPVMRRRSHSSSLGRKRRSRSTSPMRRRRSRSSTPARYSKSPIRSWWSKSITNRQRSRSISAARRLRSKSRSAGRWQRSKTRSASRRHRSRTRSTSRRHRSRTRSTARRRRTRTRSVVRRRRSRTRSAARRRRSRTRSTARRRRSRTRSTARKRKSRSASVAKKHKSKSRSVSRSKRSMSRSVSRRRKSRSTSKRRRSRSASKRRRSRSTNRRQRSRSATMRRKSRSQSPARRQRSVSSSKRKRTWSRSASRKRRSLSRSAAGKRRSRSQTDERHQSQSASGRRRSRSQSAAGRRRSRSLSAAGRCRSRSRSVATRETSRSRSKAKKDSPKSLSVRKRSRSGSLKKGSQVALKQPIMAQTSNAEEQTKTLVNSEKISEENTIEKQTTYHPTPSPILQVSHSFYQKSDQEHKSSYLTSTAPQTDQCHSDSADKPAACFETPKGPLEYCISKVSTEPSLSSTSGQRESSNINASPLKIINDCTSTEFAEERLCATHDELKLGKIDTAVNKNVDKGNKLKPMPPETDQVFQQPGGSSIQMAKTTSMEENVCESTIAEQGFKETEILKKPIFKLSLSMKSNALEPHVPTDTIKHTRSKLFDHEYNLANMQESNAAILCSEHEQSEMLQQEQCVSDTAIKHQPLQTSMPAVVEFSVSQIVPETTEHIESNVCPKPKYNAGIQSEILDCVTKVKETILPIPFAFQEPESTVKSRVGSKSVDTENSTPAEHDIIHPGTHNEQRCSNLPAGNILPFNLNVTQENEECSLEQNTNSVKSDTTKSIQCVALAVQDFDSLSDEKELCPIHTVSGIDALYSAKSKNKKQVHSDCISDDVSEIETSVCTVDHNHSNSTINVIQNNVTSISHVPIETCNTEEYQHILFEPTSTLGIATEQDPMSATNIKIAEDAVLNKQFSNVSSSIPAEQTEMHFLKMQETLASKLTTNNEHHQSAENLCQSHFENNSGHPPFTSQNITTMEFRNSDTNVEQKPFNSSSVVEDNSKFTSPIKLKNTIDNFGLADINDKSNIEVFQADPELNIISEFNIKSDQAPFQLNTAKHIKGGDLELISEHEPEEQKDLCRRQTAELSTAEQNFQECEPTLDIEHLQDKKQGMYPSTEHAKLVCLSYTNAETLNFQSSDNAKLLTDPPSEHSEPPFCVLPEDKPLVCLPPGDPELLACPPAEDAKPLNCAPLKGDELLTCRHLDNAKAPSSLSPEDTKSLTCPVTEDLVLVTCQHPVDTKLMSLIPKETEQPGLQPARFVKQKTSISMGNMLKSGSVDEQQDSKYATVDKAATSIQSTFSEQIPKEYSISSEQSSFSKKIDETTFHPSNRNSQKVYKSFTTDAAIICRSTGNASPCRETLNTFDMHETPTFKISDNYAACDIATSKQGFVHKDMELNMFQGYKSKEDVHQSTAVDKPMTCKPLSSTKKGEIKYLRVDEERDIQLHLTKRKQVQSAPEIDHVNIFQNPKENLSIEIREPVNSLPSVKMATLSIKPVALKETNEYAEKSQLSIPIKKDLVKTTIKLNENYSKSDVRFSISNEQRSEVICEAVTSSNNEPHQYSILPENENIKLNQGDLLNLNIVKKLSNPSSTELTLLQTESLHSNKYAGHKSFIPSQLSREANTNKATMRQDRFDSRVEQESSAMLEQGPLQSSVIKDNKQKKYDALGQQLFDPSDISELEIHKLYSKDQRENTEHCSLDLATKHTKQSNFEKWSLKSEATNDCKNSDLFPNEVSDQFTSTAVSKHANIAFKSKINAKGQRLYESNQTKHTELSKHEMQKYDMTIRHKGNPSIGMSLPINFRFSRTFKPIHISPLQHGSEDTTSLALEPSKVSSVSAAEPLPLNFPSLLEQTKSSTMAQEPSTLSSQRPPGSTAQSTTDLTLLSALSRQESSRSSSPSEPEKLHSGISKPDHILLETLTFPESSGPQSLSAENHPQTSNFPGVEPLQSDSISKPELSQSTSTVKPAFPHISNVISKLGVKQRQYRSRSTAQESRSPSVDRGQISRSRSKSTSHKRRSKSVGRKKQSQSTTRRRRSHSKSEVRRRRSRSKSIRRSRKRRSRSKSKGRKKCSPSKSAGKRRRSRSKSLQRKRHSRSKSAVKKRCSRSKSISRKKRSRSTGRKRHSRSKSIGRRRRSHTKSPAWRRRSRSKSISRGSHSPSKSPSWRRRSLSKSSSPKRRSHSRRGHSLSKSPAPWRRSRSRSHGRWRRSKSRSRWRRSRSLSISRRRRSRSASRLSRSLSAKRRQSSLSKSPMRKGRSRSQTRQRDRSPLSRCKSKSTSPPPPPPPPKKQVQSKSLASKQSAGLKSLIQKQLLKAKAQSSSAKNKEPLTMPDLTVGRKMPSLAARAQMPVPNQNVRTQWLSSKLTPETPQIPMPDLATGHHAPIHNLAPGTQWSIPEMAVEAQWPISGITGEAQWPMSDLRSGTQWPIPDLQHGIQWPVADMRPGSHWPMSEGSETQWSVGDLSAGTQWQMSDLSAGNQWSVPDIAAGTQWPVPDIAAGTQWPVPDLTAGTHWTVPDLAIGTQGTVPDLAVGTQRSVPDLTICTPTIPDLAAGTQRSLPDLAAGIQQSLPDLASSAHLPVLHPDLTAGAQITVPDLTEGAEVPQSCLPVVAEHGTEEQQLYVAAETEVPGLVTETAALMQIPQPYLTTEAEAITEIPRSYLAAEEVPNLEVEPTVTDMSQPYLTSAAEVPDLSTEAEAVNEVPQSYMTIRAETVTEVHQSYLTAETDVPDLAAEAAASIGIPQSYLTAGSEVPDLAAEAVTVIEVPQTHLSNGADVPDLVAEADTVRELPLFSLTPGAEVPDLSADTNSVTEIQPSYLAAGAEVPDLTAEEANLTEIAQSNVVAGAEVPDLTTEAQTAAEMSHSYLVSGAEVPDLESGAETVNDLSQLYLPVGAEVLTEVQQSSLSSGAEVPDMLADSEAVTEVQQPYLEDGAEVPNLEAGADDMAEMSQPYRIAGSGAMSEMPYSYLAAGVEVPDMATGAEALTEVPQSYHANGAEVPDMTDAEPLADVRQPYFMTETEAVTEVSYIGTGAEVPDMIADTEAITELPQSSLTAGAEVPDMIAGTETITELPQSSLITAAEVPDMIAGTETITELPQSSLITAAEVPDMIAGTETITELPRSSLITGAEVPDMIAGTEAITELPQSSLITAAEVPDMIAGTETITELPRSSLITAAEVPDMIAGTEAITELPQSSLITAAEVPDMIAGTETITELPQSSLITGAEVPGMIAGTETITELPQSSLITGAEVPDMIAGTDSITELPRSSLITAAEVPDMIAGTETITELPQSSLITAAEVPDMIAGTETIKELPQSSLITAAEVPDMIAGTETITELPVSSLITAAEVPGMIAGTETITELPQSSLITAAEVPGMIAGTETITELPQSSLITAAEVPGMIAGTETITELPQSSLITAAEVPGMIAGTETITELPQSSLITGAEMPDMIAGTETKTELPQSSLITAAEVPDMIAGTETITELPQSSLIAGAEQPDMIAGTETITELPQSSLIAGAEVTLACPTAGAEVPDMLAGPATMTHVPQLHQVTEVELPEVRFLPQTSSEVHYSYLTTGAVDTHLGSGAVAITTMPQPCMLARAEEASKVMPTYLTAEVEMHSLDAKAETQIEVSQSYLVTDPEAPNLEDGVEAVTEIPHSYVLAGAEAATEMPQLYLVTGAEPVSEMPQLYLVDGAEIKQSIPEAEAQAFQLKLAVVPDRAIKAQDLNLTTEKQDFRTAYTSSLNKHIELWEGGTLKNEEENTHLYVGSKPSVCTDQQEQLFDVNNPSTNEVCAGTATSHPLLHEPHSSSDHLLLDETLSINNHSVEDIPLASTDNFIQDIPTTHHPLLDDSPARCDHPLKDNSCDRSDSLQDKSPASSNYKLKEDSPSRSNYPFQDDFSTSNDHTIQDSLIAKNNSPLQEDSLASGDHQLQDDSSACIDCPLQNNVTTSSNNMCQVDFLTSNDHLLQDNFSASTDCALQDDLSASNDHLKQADSLASNDSPLQDKSTACSDSLLQVKSPGHSDHQLQYSSCASSDYQRQDNPPTSSDHQHHANSATSSDHQLQDSSPALNEDQLRNNSAICTDLLNNNSIACTDHPHQTCFSANKVVTWPVQSTITTDLAFPAELPCNTSTLPLAEPFADHDLSSTLANNEKQSLHDGKPASELLTSPSNSSAELAVEQIDSVTKVFDEMVHSDQQYKITPPNLLPYDSEQVTEPCVTVSEATSEQVLFNSEPPPELLPYDSEQPAGHYFSVLENPSEQASLVFHTPPELLPYDSDQPAIHAPYFETSVDQETTNNKLSTFSQSIQESVQPCSSELMTVNDQTTDHKPCASVLNTANISYKSGNDIELSDAAHKELHYLSETPSNEQFITSDDSLIMSTQTEEQLSFSGLVSEQSVEPPFINSTLLEHELLSSSELSTEKNSNGDQKDLSLPELGTGKLVSVVEQSSVESLVLTKSVEKQLSLPELPLTSKQQCTPAKELIITSEQQEQSIIQLEVTKKRSRSKSLGTSRARDSRSKSISRKKRSHSKSIERKRSRSKSITCRKRSRSKSETRKRRSQSKTITRRKKSRSISTTRKKRSRSKSSIKRRRSRSKSNTRRRRSLSKSTTRRKRSRSKSAVRKRRSMSRARKRRSRSKSRTRKRRSRSTSVTRKRRSRSTSVTRKRRSRSTSVIRKRRSRSTSVTRKRRSCSTSVTRKRRSRSTSVACKRRSRSTSEDHKKRSRSSSIANTRRSHSPSETHKRRSHSKSVTPALKRARSKSDCSRSPSQTNARTRKTQSRSSSRDKNKLSEKRRKRSNSKEHYSIKTRRRSRSPQRRKKSRSPLRRTNLCVSPVRRRRSRSPIRRKSFSRSPIRRKRSRSRDMSMDSSRSPKRLTDLDKAQLLEIAKANAAVMCAKAGVPLPPSLKPAIAPTAPVEDKGTHRTYGVTIQELTEKCKQIAQSKEDDVIVNKPHDSDEDDDEERPFYNHPFKVSEHKPISFSLLNPSIKPAPKNQVTLTKEFPVSSGSQHRKKEDKVYGEWVPVDKKTEEGKDDVFSNTGPSQLSDITQVLTERALAQARIAGNPFDLEALFLLNRAQEQIDAWTQSALPGMFTGSTGAQVLTADEISNSGPQAWLKKDQFLKAAPVTGGRGALLMRKMGWKEGEGLGRFNEGNVNPILVDFKTDRKGLLADGEKAPNKVALPIMKDLFGKHPISALMELCNKKKWSPPEFVLVDDAGPDHRKRFLFRVTVNGVVHQPSQPSMNKKLAKATAAAGVLLALGHQPVSSTVSSTSNFLSASTSSV